MITMRGRTCALYHIFRARREVMNRWWLRKRLHAGKQTGLFAGALQYRVKVTRRARG